jgi:16S rRNA U516 pseudouridylate synthase RsuA-like enzyme
LPIYQERRRRLLSMYYLHYDGDLSLKQTACCYAYLHFFIIIKTLSFKDGAPCEKHQQSTINIQQHHRPQTMTALAVKQLKMMISFEATTKIMHLPKRAYATAAVLIIFLIATATQSTLAFTTPSSIHRRGALLNSKSDDYNNDFIEPTSPSSSEEGIRLNKVFKATHSRRAADKLIEEGRVSVNGQRVHSKGGYKVIPFRDVVTLDGQVVKGWEQINAISRDDTSDNNDELVNRNHKTHKQKRSQHDTTTTSHKNNLQTSSFEYVKYYKPIGVTCTTDLRVKDNIIDAIHQDGYIGGRHGHRVYPVGRLDKETSGLILLTSDGRIVNAVLRGERKQPKVYKVKVDGLLEDRHLERLRVGIYS